LEDRIVTALSESILAWIAQASDEFLREKLTEYQARLDTGNARDDQHLPPLIGALRVELKKRELANVA
jgi:hypothetical protein